MHGQQNIKFSVDIFNPSALAWVPEQNFSPGPEPARGGSDNKANSQIVTTQTAHIRLDMSGSIVVSSVA